MKGVEGVGKKGCEGGGVGRDGGTKGKIVSAQMGIWRRHLVTKSVGYCQ